MALRFEITDSEFEDAIRSGVFDVASNEGGTSYTVHNSDRRDGKNPPPCRVLAVHHSDDGSHELVIELG